MSGQADDDSGGEGKLTLAFELAALNVFMNPQKVFADARQWCRYVGVVGDDAHAVKSAVRRHNIRQDFEIGHLDKQSVLSKVKWEADTDRYVFVGTGEQDEALADYVGWEYLPVEEAANKAGWTLEEDVGIFERIRGFLAHVFLWSVNTR